MFKKVVVADTCAIYVDDIFAQHATYPGPTLMLGAEQPNNPEIPA